MGFVYTYVCVPCEHACTHVLVCVCIRVACTSVCVRVCQACLLKQGAPITGTLVCFNIRSVSFANVYAVLSHSATHDCEVNLPCSN